MKNSKYLVIVVIALLTFTTTVNAQTKAPHEKTVEQMLEILSPDRSGVSGKTLAVEKYLDQVKTGGKGYQAVNDSVEGLAKQKLQTDLLYSPQLVAHVQRINDKGEKTSPQFSGDKTVADDYGVALVKKWKYGATTSLNYGWSRTQTEGTQYTGLTDPIYQVRPSASVTVPLWRDFLGTQTRAQMEKSRSQIESAQFNAAHQREALLFQSRTTYWNLRLARDVVSIREETLARAITVEQWSSKRVGLRLAENAELLQAKAARRVRELELQQALEDERSARVSFNRLRGVEGDKVPELLPPLEGQTEKLSYQWPVDAPLRWDMKSAEAQARSDQAAWRDAKANARPDLNIYASYASNGLDSTFDPAHLESTNGKNPTAVVGAQIVVPLDIFTAGKVAEGYGKNYRASKLTYQDKGLQIRQEWEQLGEHLKDVDHRLTLVEEIVKIQKQKAENERSRLHLGRTTQFQVQSYETEYSSSQLQRLSMLAEKLALWAEAEWMLAADREAKAKEPQKATEEVKP